ncbi:MAG: hypothetical protein PWP60_820 [Candidatus Atribacteria bacterium]|jgi:anti-sigma regulatory factor (Ser/Thr protein kinase)|uniref:Anti-sigma regulatory factor n=1 Tax=Thermatribacter velox TaxID=3039681 RepID=A0ABZ2Y8F2_9BACT|nr:hypothetical protein [Candidatus Atribacteria bacterium]
MKQTNNEPLISLQRNINGGDFQSAGDISSEIKKILQQTGFPPNFTRRVVIAAYEAEMNVVIHAYRGVFSVDIYPDRVHIVVDDEGPGIPDLELAFQEGYSTAPPHIREMGFGAGYGLSNMKKCSDQLNIETQVGKGTKVIMDFLLKNKA